MAVVISHVIKDGAWMRTVMGVKAEGWTQELQGGGVGDGLDLERDDGENRIKDD